MTVRTNKRRDAEDLLEAVFRALIEHFASPDLPGPRLYFLAVRSGGKDKDPRPAFMTRLIEFLHDESEEDAGPAVRRFSASRRAGGFVTDRRSLRWRGGDRATAYAQWLAHARDATDLTLRFGAEGGGKGEVRRWVVTEKTVRSREPRGQRAGP